MAAETKQVGKRRFGVAYRWNGEYWYRDEGLLRRTLKWFAWFGGWEAHSPKRPWVKRPRSLRERLGMLTPISLLGHRLTLYGWGWTLHLRGTTLTSSRGQLYLSPDGTSESATVWFRGAPSHVRSAADQTEHEQAARFAQLEAEAS